MPACTEKCPKKVRLPVPRPSRRARQTMMESPGVIRRRGLIFAKLSDDRAGSYAARWIRGSLRRSIFWHPDQQSPITNLSFPSGLGMSI